MLTDTNWRRFLYFSIILFVAAAITLVIELIPETTIIPSSAINALWINIIIQLVFVTGILWIMWKDKRGDRKKELLIIIGALAILLSIIVLDGVFAYYGDPDQHSTAISMLITCILDFIAGLIIIFAAIFRKSRTSPK